MMRSLLIAGLGAVILSGLMGSQLRAQEGTAERVGERIDRGLEELGQRLRRTWDDIRRSVDELGVRGRVYGRLRWDKALADHTIDIHVHDKDVVVLRGNLPDEATRDKAVQLTQDTVGVREVVDELQVKAEDAPPGT